MSLMKVLIGVAAITALYSSHDGLDAVVVGSSPVPGSSGHALPPRTDAHPTVQAGAPRSVAARQQQVIALLSPQAAVTVYPQPFTVRAQASSGLPVHYKSITPAVCSIDGVNGRSLAAGVCTIVADQFGNDAVMPAAQVRTTFRILKATQEIAFSPPSEVPAGASATALEAAASSGLPVRFSSLTPAVCSIVGRSVAPVASAGVCTIRVFQEGNANFEAAQAQGTTIVCPQVVLNDHAPTRWIGHFRATAGSARYAVVRFSTQQVVSAFFGSDDYVDAGGPIEVTTSGKVEGCTGTVRIVLTLKRENVSRPTVLRLTGLVDPRSERQPISGSYTSNEISASTGLEEDGTFVMERE